MLQKFLIAALFLVIMTMGQVPKEMTYQGVLTDNTGKPLSGNYQLTFKLYNAETNGGLLWAEIHSGVTITDGLFRVVLGTIDPVGNPLDLPFDAPYWVGVQVESDPELTPRMRLTSVGYSFRSLRSDSVEHLAKNAVQTANIQNGAITQAKLDSTVSCPVKITPRLSGNGTTTEPLDIHQQGATNGQVLKWNGSAWVPGTGSGSGSTLDESYDHGGSGAGRIITADAGAVEIVGAYGLSVNGPVNASRISVRDSLTTSEMMVKGTVSAADLSLTGNANVEELTATGTVTANQYIGDGSQLSNVKPVAAYSGGNMRYQITANYGTYNRVKTVTITVPAAGICIVFASGYVDWESTGWDLLLSGILMSNPNTSWPAESEWYSYLNILTDYNCADSSDQYTSFSQHRGFTVYSGGTYTFNLWANKYSSASITEVGDVNMSVMYFPTGGTPAAVRQKVETVSRPINPNSITGD
jgi:hypothetical protein